MIPIYYLFEVDKGRRFFMLGGATGAALQAMQRKKKEGTFNPANPLAGTQLDKMHTKASHTAAAIKHGRDTARSVGNLLGHEKAQGIVNKSDTLSNLRDRAKRVEQSMNRVTDTLDKVQADKPMTRRAFNKKLLGTMGKGGRKYINYKLGGIKRLANLVGGVPQTHGALAALAGEKSKVLNIGSRLGRVFASKQEDIKDLEKLELVGEYS